MSDTVERVKAAMSRAYPHLDAEDTELTAHLARLALAALAEPEGMEEAVMAAARARQDNSGQFPGRPVTEAFIEQARFYVEAAAPLLLAQPLQEIETLKGELAIERRKYQQEIDTIRAQHREKLAQVTEAHEVTRRNYTQSLDNSNETIDGLLRERDTLAAANARLTEALEKYGRHDLDCLAAHTVHVRADCTCGLSSLLTGADR